ncbi:MAG: hypothetical protein NT122_03320 [Solirubrobacterales bacterium]|nr:hypothetical protein [Solirubrobacterales bacterium]
MPPNEMAKKADLDNTPSRRDLVTDAAITVLAERGAKGLTHRAVDAAAGLGEGSTSNLYRTRESLLMAVIERHVERELELLNAVENAVPEGRVTIPEAATLIAAMIDHLISPDHAELSAARYELFLEIRRRPELYESLATVRAGFISLMNELLTDLGIATSHGNSAAVLTLIEGMTLEGLFLASTALSTDQRKHQIANFLGSLA